MRKKSITYALLVAGVLLCPDSFAAAQSGPGYGRGSVWGWGPGMMRDGWGDYTHGRMMGRFGGCGMFDGSGDGRS